MSDMWKYYSRVHIQRSPAAQLHNHHAIGVTGIDRASLRGGVVVMVLDADPFPSRPHSKLRFEYLICSFQGSIKSFSRWLSRVGAWQATLAVYTNQVANL